MKQQENTKNAFEVLISQMPEDKYQVTVKHLSSGWDVSYAVDYLEICTYVNYGRDRLLAALEELKNG